LGATLRFVDGRVLAWAKIFVHDEEDGAGHILQVPYLWYEHDIFVVGSRLHFFAVDPNAAGLRMFGIN